MVLESGERVQLNPAAVELMESLREGLGSDTVFGVYAVGSTVYAATDSGLSTKSGAAAPTITGVSPSTGSAAGGTAITISGTNFTSGGSFGVTVGGDTATGATLVSSTPTPDPTPTPTPTASAAAVVVPAAGPLTVAQMLATRPGQVALFTASDVSALASSVVAVMSPAQIAAMARAAFAGFIAALTAWGEAVHERRFMTECCGAWHPGIAPGQFLPRTQAQAPERPASGTKHR